MFRISREKLDSEVGDLDIMSCRKQREQRDGDGGCGGKDGNVETEEDEEDLDAEDEEEFSDEEETDGSRTAYKKNRWRVVAVWTHITKMEAYKAAAEIMTADFNIAGGPTHSWGEPTDKKIGPCSSRSVSVNNFIYVCLVIENHGIDLLRLCRIMKGRRYRMQCRGYTGVHYSNRATAGFNGG